MRIRNRSGQVVSALAVLAFALSACGGGRPGVEEWIPVWEHTLADVPTEETIAEGPSHEVCAQAILSLRIHQGTLFPTPDKSIDDTVRNWVEVAEGTFFDCPPSDGFPEAYGEMRRLQEEIEVVLETDHTS